ncbi:MAG: putative hydro-lyase [Alkalicoccus sp.]|nr:MAG: putative hydro-lyase [Alkalicoccus sp.]
MNSPDLERRRMRNGEWATSTAGLCRSYLQTNLVILPKNEAEHFAAFAAKNPKACPVIEEMPPGVYTPESAPSADIRTDLPKYRVYRDGKLAEKRSDIQSLWKDDFVTFLIGCSFTFEEALVQGGIPLRHIEEQKNVAMYRTTRPAEEAGPFSGPLVVSMRPVKTGDVQKAAEITRKYPEVHGGPVHAGNPEEIGITSIESPDYGEAVEIKEDEVPVFWACGVTPQAALLNAELPLVITHEPGCMFITDWTYEDLQKRNKRQGL